jgi:hypothetical protein
MATVEVKCGECGFPQQVDESALGTQVECPKCKESFYAEAGDVYDLLDEPAAGPIVDHRGDRVQAPRRGQPTPRPVAGKPRPEPRPETPQDRALRERMERWADQMER